MVYEFISTLNDAAEDQLTMLALRTWLLLVGAVFVPAGSPERAWFVAGLASLWKTSFDEKPVTWDRIVLNLEELPWIPLIQEAPWKEVWDEVEAMRCYDLP